MVTLHDGTTYLKLNIFVMTALNIIIEGKSYVDFNEWTIVKCQVSNFFTTSKKIVALLCYCAVVARL